ncbi:MAG TPA: hypothetical protein VHV83_21145 [Armatimonadota bacterium]|nr:hypothetical protein [Armatimonadota bacterium]
MRVDRHTVFTSLLLFIFGMVSPCRPDPVQTQDGFTGVTSFTLACDHSTTQRDLLVLNHPERVRISIRLNNGTPLSVKNKFITLHRESRLGSSDIGSSFTQCMKDYQQKWQLSQAIQIPGDDSRGNHAIIPNKAGTYTLRAWLSSYNHGRWVRVASDNYVTISVSSPDKIPLGDSVTASGPDAFRVYVPTKWGGTLTIRTTAGTIDGLHNASTGMAYTNGGQIGQNQQGWYVFKVNGATDYTVSNTFTQQRAVSRKPWTCQWYPMPNELPPHLYDVGAALEVYDRAFGTHALAVEKQCWLFTGKHFLAKKSTSERDAERTWGYDINNADGDNNVWTGWDPNVTYDWNHNGNTSDTMDASWFGHCDMATAVMLCENEPTGNSYGPNGTVFTQEIKKQLLVCLYHGFTASTFEGYDITPHVWHRCLESCIIGQDRMFGCDVENRDFSSRDFVWNFPVYAMKTSYRESPGRNNEKYVEVTCEANYWLKGPKTLYYKYSVWYNGAGVASSSTLNDWQVHPKAPARKQRPDSVWLVNRQTSITKYWDGQLDYNRIRQIVSSQ